MTGAPAFGSLAGLKVLDLTLMLAGPFCTQLLADHGADVIKVEPPTGDLTRGIGPFLPGDEAKNTSGYFQSINRNKRSIVLDLKTGEGRAALRRLAAQADVLVENFRVGVMDRLGLSYENLCTDNPHLVYASIRGFGDPRTGISPYTEWPAFDVVAQAMGGIVAITGPDPNTPTKIGPGVGDLVPALMCAFGIMAAVYSAERTGKGQYVDVSMVDSMLAICERTVFQNAYQGTVPGPEGNHHPMICPFGLFPAKDGMVTVACTGNAFFEVFCRALDAGDLLEDPRFESPEARAKNRPHCIEAISALTRGFTKAELTKRLGGKVPFGPVMNIADIRADPHFAAREMLVPMSLPDGAGDVVVAGVPIRMSETPGGVHARAPMLGEHGPAILAGAGFTEQEIGALREAGATR